MADFYIKQGDRAPTITSQLLDGDGNPINLTGAAIWFVMRAADAATTLVNSPGVVDDAAAGRVAYWWATQDTVTPGVYLAEWRVAFADLREQTFPNDRHLVVEVVADVPSGGTVDLAAVAWIRGWVGATPDDSELGALLTIHGTRTQVALAVLRARRADLLTQPVSLTIPGDLSVNYGQNLTALNAAIAQLEAIAVADDAAADGDSGIGNLAGARLVRKGGGWGR